MNAESRGKWGCLCGVAVILILVMIAFRQTMLQAAVTSGSTLLARLPLLLGADINSMPLRDKLDKLERGRTPLYIAVNRRDIPMLKFLLGHGAKPNQLTQSRFVGTPLTAAAKISDVGLLKLLLENGADPDVDSTAIDTNALVVSTRNACEECVSVLLAAKVRFAAASHSSAAFGVARASRNRKILKLLLPHLAEVYREKFQALNNIPLPELSSQELDQTADLIADNDWESVTRTLMAENKPGVLSMLMLAEPELSWKDHYELPLHIASRNGSVDLIRLLARAGAPVDGEDSGKNTALTNALQYCHVEAARVLVDELHARVTGGGRKLIHIRPAPMTGRADPECFRETLKLLTRAGADINDVDRYGDTLLHLLASGGPVSYISIAVEQGANVNAVNSNGETPLHQAVRSHSRDAVQVLLEKGASKNIRDETGDTPFEKEVKSGARPEMMKMLDPGDSRRN